MKAHARKEATPSPKAIQHAAPTTPAPLLNGNPGISTQLRFSGMLNGGPRVTQLLEMRERLNRGGDGPPQSDASPPNSEVIQRRVGPDQGHPGLKVQIVGGDETGVIRRRLMRDEVHIGYWVQTRVQVDNDLGQFPYTFDQLDPVGGVQLPTVGEGAFTVPSNRPAVIGEDGRISHPPQSIDLSAEMGDGRILPGEGVQFQDEFGFWHDGYCTDIADGVYTIAIAGKLIRDHFGESSLKLPGDRVRTSREIRERLGHKKTKSSKRDWSASELATTGQIREAAGLSSAVSTFLLRNPVLFGQVLRSGGHVGSGEFEGVAEGMGIEVAFPTATRGKSKGSRVENAIVANDTFALLATRLDDLEHGPGEWQLHGKVTAEKAADHPTLSEGDIRKLKKINLAAFRHQFIFQQGGTGQEVMNLPQGDKRKSLHAEAKAVRSPTWSHILEQTALEFMPQEEGLGKERRPPPRRKIISIALNRSSCGSKAKSGYSGGCAGELAAVIAQFWNDLGIRLGDPSYAQALQREGLIQIEVSVGGEYEHPGDVGLLIKAGAVVRTHPTYDFAADMPEPLTARKYEFMKRLAESGKGGKVPSELIELLLGLLQAAQPARQPVRHLSAGLGQHQVVGRAHTGHTGRIACTSIAACALQAALDDPEAVRAGTVSPEDLVNVMAMGTDVDRELRDALAPQPGIEALIPEFDEESPPKVQGAGKSAEKDIDRAVEERYFAHDEVHDRFPRIEADQGAVDALEPQYLYGVRGDYRRIARQLARMGPRTGLLVTIGASTIAVANVSPPLGGPLFALFDSHGDAILETYASEESLTDALEALYPALPGAGEMNSAWNATPYRRRA